MLIKKITKMSLIIAFIFGMIASLFMIYIAWQHNPQQEFHTENLIYWNNLIPIGLSWLIAVSGTTFTFTIIVFSALKFLKLAFKRK